MCIIHYVGDVACSPWPIPAFWTCITLEKKACTLDQSQGSQHVLHLRRLVVALIDHKLFFTCITLKRTYDPWGYHKHYFTHHTWECIKTHEITETLSRRTVINANGIIPIYLSHIRYSGMKKVFEHYGPSYHMVYIVHWWAHTRNRNRLAMVTRTVLRIHNCDSKKIKDPVLVNNHNLQIFWNTNQITVTMKLPIHVLFFHENGWFFKAFEVITRTCHCPIRDSFSKNHNQQFSNLESISKNWNQWFFRNSNNRTTLE